jgi:hypothetical protein
MSSPGSARKATFPEADAPALDPNWRFKWDRPVVPHPLWIERARTWPSSGEFIREGKAQAEREERMKGIAGGETVKALTAGVKAWLEQARAKQLARCRVQLLRVLSRRP